MIIDIFKMVAMGVSSVGASVVASNAIKVLTPANLSPAKKVLTIIGASVLGGIAGNSAANYVSDEIDDAVEVLKKLGESE